ncbi:UdgX family uracil-DNA binding protein [Rhizobium sp. 18065]|uniref:UdgX family uracil-DNA binding protein n=1 Tax=Rhizobium sp. 18065 TaxID=2681411 RepID=UPI00135BD7CD|nr:UdgX family uracil-DNA binding protein [Rhizobium sp. 18065]
MPVVSLDGRGDLEEWREAARSLLSAHVHPDDVRWIISGGADDLFGGDACANNQGQYGEKAQALSVPRAFMEAADAALCHCAPDRFALLYRILWRLQSDRWLLGDAADRDIVHLKALIKNVRRDAHKMTAFVRFREVPDRRVEERRCFVAWFEPEHFIVARTAPFFQRRFTDMDWVIATPKGSAIWDGRSLEISAEPAERPQAEDATDDLWRTYFANIFNPARLKVKAMQAEMPKKYWKNMPEADLIPGLIAGAEQRVAKMAAREASQPPAFHDRLQAAWQERTEDEDGEPQDALAGLKREAASCDRCPLHCHATQTVFGEGPIGAALMFVGEQPGDQEDLAGRVFVGPAGKVFDHALMSAGIVREQAYVTNAVKHFKYEMRGKRRIHQRPNVGEIEHCRWWLAGELDIVKPKLVVAMGGSAYFALTGERKALEDVRGHPLALANEQILFVTVHPSYLLRIPEETRRQQEIARFQSDMLAIRKVLQAC